MTLSVVVNKKGDLFIDSKDTCDRLRSIITTGLDAKQRFFFLAFAIDAHAYRRHILIRMYTGIIEVMKLIVQQIVFLLHSYYLNNLYYRDLRIVKMTSVLIVSYSTVRSLCIDLLVRKDQSGIYTIM